MLTENCPFDGHRPTPDTGHLFAGSGASCVPTVTPADGDLFPGGETVITARLDAEARTVTVFTDDGGIRRLGLNARVVLAYRDAPGFPDHARCSRSEYAPAVLTSALAVSTAPSSRQGPPALPTGGT